MNDISCGVCMDLMPLVKDGVASEDSRRLVKEHIAGCERCAAAFGSTAGLENKADAELNDSVVVAKMKKQLMLFLAGAILAGALLGMAISDGMGMFYNVLIMPVIGAFGYLLLKKKAYLVPLGLFLFVFLWMAVREAAAGYLTHGSGGAAELALMSAWWASIYAAFSAVGLIIAWLLHFAFKKDA